jgi:hypothetical protein
MNLSLLKAFLALLIIWSSSKTIVYAYGNRTSAYNVVNEANDKSHILSEVTSGEAYSQTNREDLAKRFEFTNKIADNYIWPTVPICFLITGTVANILSIIVFTRPEMRKFSSFCYFAFLNAINLAVLYVTMIRVIMEFNFKTDIRKLNLFTCKSHVFLTYFLGHLSSLLLCIISIDRVISVMFLRRAKELCTPRVAFMVTVAMIVINFLMSSHFIYMDSGHVNVVYEITMASSTPGILTQPKINYTEVICEAPHNTTYGYFVRDTWKIIDMSIYAFIPFTIMLTSSVIIIVRVAQQSKKFNNSKRRATSAADMSRRQSERKALVSLAPAEHSNRNSASVFFKKNSVDTTSLYSVQTSVIAAPSRQANGLSVNGASVEATARSRNPSQSLVPLGSATATSRSEARFSSRTRNLALMLIPVNILFLLFLAPVVICMYVYEYLGDDHLTLVIVELLSYCNFTFNFFIYFLTSSKFRDEFFKFVNETLAKLNENKNNTMGMGVSASTAPCSSSLFNLKKRKEQQSSKQQRRESGSSCNRRQNRADSLDDKTETVNNSLRRNEAIENNN